jgi:hypothetical protein
MGIILTQQFLWGALAATSAVAMLFFFRHWQRTQDRLFFIFGLAFCALGLNWLGLALTDPTSEGVHYMYVARLVAFLLFLVGILDRNRRA